MRISFLNHNLTNIPKINSFKTNPLTFNARKSRYDDFDEYLSNVEKREARRKSKDYQTALKTNLQTAFLYNPHSDNNEILKLAEENKDVVWNLKTFAKNANIDMGNVAFLAENGLINEVRAGKNIYFDSSDELNQTFLKNRSSWIPKRRFMEEYNYTLTELNEDIDFGYLVCVVEEKGSSISNFIDVENPQNQETIKRHFKILPKQSNYLFLKPEKEKNPTPALYLARMGFGPIKAIIKAIDEGAIDGVAQRITVEGKRKIRCNVDINSQKSLAALAKLRKQNPDVVEILELRDKLSMTKEEILDAVLDDKLEIIPEYIFAKEKRKVFFDLTTEKNKAFVEKRQEELNQKAKEQQENNLIFVDFKQKT